MLVILTVMVQSKIAAIENYSCVKFSIGAFAHVTVEFGLTLLSVRLVKVWLIDFSGSGISPNG